MDIREYVAALRKRWYVVAILAMIGASWGLYQGATTAPQYRATSQVFVSLSGGASAAELVQGSTYTQNLVQSYAKLATMPAVLDPVIDRLDLDTDSKSLARSVAAEAPLDTVIIQITATQGTPEMSADVANAVAEQLKKTVADLSPSSGGRDTVQVTVTAPASEPTYPVAPNKRRLLLIGLSLGLGLGVATALLWHLLDTRVRSSEDIERLTSAPILGSIPQLGRQRGHTPTATSPTSVASEAYRRLQTNLQFLDASSRVRRIVITSALSGEGKSRTAINLALAVAEQGMSVLLIDADLRRPSIARYCNLESAAGLTTVLIGRAEFESVVQEWGPNGLNVLTAGSLPPNPSILVGSAAMSAVLEEAGRRYDVVVVDAPPLLPVADAVVLTRLTDGAVVVADCQQVNAKQLGDALSTLDTVDARCLGIVANRVSSVARQSYYGTTSKRWHRLRLPWFDSRSPAARGHAAGGG